MATTTAIILVGHAHPNDGGINPTHLIQLTENNRPALILRSADGNDEPRIMIPTLENMVDDIYLFIATYVLQVVKSARPINDPTRESMYDLYTEEERKALYTETLNALQQTKFKVVFHILHSSYLLRQLELLLRFLGPR